MYKITIEQHSQHFHGAVSTSGGDCVFAIECAAGITSASAMGVAIGEAIATISTCVSCDEPTIEIVRGRIGDHEGVLCADCQFHCDGNIITEEG